MSTDRPLAPTDPPSETSNQPRRFGRYWLLRLIARGGMGEVYLAATTGIEGAERPCVVKIIRREHANDASFLARFLDEARVQAQLQHPGVVQVIEAAIDEKGEPFVVVEYVEGRSLGELRARALQLAYRLSWPEAVALCASAAEALAHVHERVDIRGNPLGIVHRDLSPQNLMVSYSGDVKLIDFGTARGENRRCHTVSGVVFAKPGYVAPEVANGQTGDARLDLYALGIMLWELAAGRRFLQGEPAEHLAAVANNERPTPPIAQLLGAPAYLDAIIEKLTAFDPEQRFVSARVALTELDELLSSAPALSNGERGVRARISQLMLTLYPSEPTQSRRSFARLVAYARRLERGESQALLAPPPSTPSETPVRTASETDPRILPGTSYRLGRVLGKGAMGTVYEAEHTELGRRLAIKVLAPEHATSSDYAARFRREARALSRLSHPNLVTLHDFGQATDGRLFCAMEYLEGESLEQHLNLHPTLPWRKALGLGVQVCQALGQAHHVGLVHRDLKPANLFLCRDEMLKLLDFGVVKTSDERVEGTDDPSTYKLFGTPEYMAPEQIGGGPVDARADLYSLGCVLYQLCTGKLPHEASSAVALLEAKRSREPAPLRTMPSCKTLPAEAERVILKALAREPAKRYRSAEEMQAALQSALESPERRRRQRKTLGLVALSAALSLTLLALGSQVVQRGALLWHGRPIGQLVAAIASQELQPPKRLVPVEPASVASQQAPAPTATQVEKPAEPAVPAPTVEAKVELTAAVTPPSAKPQEEPSRTASARPPYAQQVERALSLHQPATALQIARQWVERAPSKQARLTLAKLLVQRGSCGEASDSVQVLLRQEGASAEAKAVLARCDSGRADSQRGRKERRTAKK